MQRSTAKPNNPLNAFLVVMLALPLLVSVIVLQSVPSLQLPAAPHTAIGAACNETEEVADALNSTDVSPVRVAKKALPFLYEPVIPPPSNQGERTGSISQPVHTRYILNVGPSVCPTLSDPSDDERCAVECRSKPPNDNYCYCFGRCQWMMDEALTRTCVCSNPSCDCVRQI